MNHPYTHVLDLAALEIPADGILSRTLHNDDQVKVVLFAFSAGQELSEHTASMPAVLQVIKGQAQFTLGDDEIAADAGFWVHMPAQLRHRIQAKTPLILLLLLLKPQPAAAR
jgi:quercetin dioxygenase-like cupin family protein